MVRRSSAVRVAGCSVPPRDGGERADFQVVVGDGPGGAFRVGDEPGGVALGEAQGRPERPGDPPAARLASMGSPRSTRRVSCSSTLTLRSLADYAGDVERE